LGGTVSFDETTFGKPVVGVSFFGVKVTNAGLEHLKELTSLRSLVLSDTQVTDAGFVHLKGLTSLESLVLGGTSVTSAGVADLQSALPKCRITK
jgi:internalin A